MTLAEELAAVEAEYAALKEDLKAGDPHTTTALQEKQRRLAFLKKRFQKLREQLAKHNQEKRKAARARQYRREELFIDLARARLGEETYNELWVEVDRLEREQWRTVWNEG